MKLKKIFAIVLTLAMVMGMAIVPSFADEPGGGDKIDNAVLEYGESAAEQAKIAAAITKSVATGKDVEIPELTYTFRIIQDKDTTVPVADGAPGNANTYSIDTADFPLNWTTVAGQTTPTGTVTIKPANSNIIGSTDYGYSDAKDYFKLESQNLFGGTVVSNIPTPVTTNTDGVAIYRYKITEDPVLVNNASEWGGTQQGGATGRVFTKPDPATKVVGEFNETLTLSQAEYEMLVYTKNNSSGSGRHIFAITVRQTKYDDGKPATNEPKKNPTPGGNPSVKGDFSDLAFENGYEKIEVTDPTNPNGQPYQLSKKVTGVNNDMAILDNTLTTAPKFDFSVKVTLPAAAPAGGTTLYGRLWTSTNGSDWAPVEAGEGEIFVNITDGAHKYYKADGTTQITRQRAVEFSFAEGETEKTHTVHLANNQKITFPDAEIGTIFDVEETDYYTTGVTGTDGAVYKLTPVVNGEAKVDFSEASDAEKLEARSDQQVVSSGAKASDYQNDGETGTTPTGIIMQYLPFFVIIALAVIALIASVVIKGSRRNAAR